MVFNYIHALDARVKTGGSEMGKQEFDAAVQADINAMIARGQIEYEIEQAKAEIRERIEDVRGTGELVRLNTRYINLLARRMQMDRGAE